MTLLALILGGIALWALTWLGRQGEGPRRGQWRVTAAVFAAVLFGLAILMTARGAWFFAVGLAGAGLYLVTEARRREVPRRAEGLTDADARSILGVPASASRAEINAAWKRLMARAHPDQGGTEGLAARLNAARDHLLKR